MLNSAWIAAYTTASNSLIRSPANIITKDEAKHAMIANARMLAKIIQGYPMLTNAQRSELGLTVQHARTPIPAPSSSPTVEIKSVKGHRQHQNAR